MKKILMALTLLALVGFLSGCAWLEEPEPDYRAAMIEAALRADVEAGRAAAQARDLHLDAAASTEARIGFDELLLLARYLKLRAGDERLSDEQRLCTGEVLLNRAAAPDFPDTLRELLDGDEAFCTAEPSLLPDRRSADAAWELLDGRRLLDPCVLYQSEGAPCGPVYATFCDRYYRTTYFCSG